jgi:putative spermidine/putrescine transport system permease protein
MKGKILQRLGITPTSLTVIAVICIGVPLGIVILTSFNSSTELAFPPRGFSLRWFMNVFKNSRFMEGVQFSAGIALVSSSISLIVGTLASLALVRYRFFGRTLINMLVFTPLIIPEVVTGITLLFFFIRLKMVNSWINITILHTILAIPYTARVLMASLYRFDMTLEEAAMSLGANPFVTFKEVTLPLIKPGLIAAWIFAFVVSFNNFTATLFLITRRGTLPIEIYSYIRTQNDPTVAALSTLLILTTVFGVGLIAKHIGLEKFSS